MARTPETGIAREARVHMRLDPKEAAALDAQRVARGGMSRSAYVRHLIQQDGARIAREKGKLT